MSLKNLTIVSLKILAIYCFCQSMPLLSTSITLLKLRGPSALDLSPTWLLFLSLLPALSLLSLAAVLFAFASPLSDRLLPAGAQESSSISCTLEQIQTLAFAVAGILVFIFALPSLFREVVWLWRLLFLESRMGTPWGNWIALTASIAQTVIGLLLIFNPKAFRNIWHYLRTAGT
jgi:hypothetical protein